jgi:ATP-dependent Clp protease adapter protein ClpS
MANKTITRPTDKIKENLTSKKRYGVYIHNDNSTAAEFVIYVLTQVFGMSVDMAGSTMIKVHRSNDKALVGIYSKDEAEKKIQHVNKLKSTYGYNEFRVTKEEI